MIHVLSTRQLSDLERGVARTGDCRHRTRSGDGGTADGFGVKRVDQSSDLQSDLDMECLGLIRGPKLVVN